jgi:hypothetical protein
MHGMQTVFVQADSTLSGRGLWHYYWDGKPLGSIPGSRCRLGSERRREELQWSLSLVEAGTDDY